jgi:hypothetical protein
MGPIQQTAELTRVMVAGERTKLISAIHEQYLRGQGMKPGSEIKRDVEAALRWLPGAARDALSKARTISPGPPTRQARVVTSHLTDQGRYHGASFPAVA